MFDHVLHLIARKLPSRIRYWVIINAAANASREHPAQHVDSITWGQMLGGKQHPEQGSK